MLIDPHTLARDLSRLEEIEKASLRLVVQAVFDFRVTAAEIFRLEGDLVQDIGEDITREALDKLGVSRIDQRLFGKIDYKRARYVFQPDYAIKQALFVDSKAEKMDGQGTATLQCSQLSLQVRQLRAGQKMNVAGRLPTVIDIGADSFLTTTIFVKYNYETLEKTNLLHSVTVAVLPNGMLQDLYNPNSTDTIFLAGRNAPTLGEEFRVRLSFHRLASKAPWRVQHIPLEPEVFEWTE